MSKPVRTIIIGLVVLVGLLAIIILGAPKNPRRVPAKVAMVTLLGYQHLTPGPWPEGNHFTLASPNAWVLPRSVENFLRRYGPGRLINKTEWSVLNMYAENFSEIVRQLKLEFVEILVLDEHTCLVVDARIPRAWFCQLPSASETRSLVMQRAVAEHPDKFSLPTAAPDNH